MSYPYGFTFPPEMNKQTKTGQNNFEGIGHKAWHTVMTQRLKTNDVSSMIITVDLREISEYSIE